MCLELVKKISCTGPRACIKGFDIGQQSDGKYKLLLPFQHQLIHVPDMMMNQNNVAKRKQIRDQHGSKYMSGWHAYKSTHKSMPHDMYVDLLSKYHTVLVNIDLREINAVGYDHDLPCYVGKSMQILNICRISKSPVVYAIDQYPHKLVDHKFDLQRFVKDITAEPVYW